MVKISEERAKQLRATVSYQRFKRLMPKILEAVYTLIPEQRTEKILRIIHEEMDYVHAYGSGRAAAVADESLQLVLQEMGE